jgi:hypothetical protein
MSVSRHVSRDTGEATALLCDDLISRSLLDGWRWLALIGLHRSEPRKIASPRGALGRRGSSFAGVGVPHWLPYSPHTHHARSRPASDQGLSCDRLLRVQEVVGRNGLHCCEGRSRCMARGTLSGSPPMIPPRRGSFASGGGGPFELHRRHHCPADAQCSPRTRHAVRLRPPYDCDRPVDCRGSFEAQVVGKLLSVGIGPAGREAGGADGGGRSALRKLSQS